MGDLQLTYAKGMASKIPERNDSRQSVRTECSWPTNPAKNPRRAHWRPALAPGLRRRLPRRVNQPTRDADRFRQGRQRVQREPVGCLDFLRVRENLPAGIVSKKGNHQRMGKWPGLADEIAQVGEADADFFPHLAGSALRQRFARFDKTGQGA